MELLNQQHIFWYQHTEIIINYLQSTVYFLITTLHIEKKILLKYLISHSLKVKNKKENKISLSDPRPVRDFGFAGDFMEAAYKILSCKPEDFIIATGHSLSVRNLSQKVAEKIKISPSKINYRMDGKIMLSQLKEHQLKKFQNIYCGNQSFIRKINNDDDQGEINTKNQIF